MVCFAIGFVHGTDRSLPSLSLSRHPFFPTRNIEPRLRSWQPGRDRCYFSSIRSSRSPSQNIARESPSAFKRCPAPIFGPPRLQRRRSERKYEGKKREERTRRGGSWSRSREIATPCVRQRSLRFLQRPWVLGIGKKKRNRLVMHRFLEGRG